MLYRIMIERTSMYRQYTSYHRYEHDNNNKRTLAPCQHNPGFGAGIKRVHILPVESGGEVG